MSECPPGKELKTICEEIAKQKQACHEDFKKTSESEVPKQEEVCQKDVKKRTKPKVPIPPVSENRTVAPILEFPHFLRVIGPKHINIMMAFVPSAIFYTLTSFVLVTYMTEWKQVLQYLPYYNGKYVKEKESTSNDE